MAIAGLGGAGARAPLAVIPPTPEAADPAIWHVASAGQAQGPYTLAQLRQAVAAGQLTGENLVWTAGMDAWTPMGRLPRLAVLFAPPPPPLG
jgi:hypothetical protein